jgi:hypothetical protein
MKYITEGSYGKQEVVVPDGTPELNQSSNYRLVVSSGYISLMFATWNYTHIKPYMVGSNSDATPAAMTNDTDTGNAAPGLHYRSGWRLPLKSNFRWSELAGRLQKEIVNPAY